MEPSQPSAHPSGKTSRPPAAPTGQPPAHFGLRLLAGLAFAALSVIGAFLLGRWLYPITGPGVTERSLLLMLGCTVALVGMAFCFGTGRWEKIQQFAARYHSLHSWIGITTGSLLAMGFLAGTITLFAAPLQQWSLPAQPACMTAALPLQEVPPIQAVLDGRGFSSKTGTGITGRNSLLPLRYQLTLSAPSMASISLVEGPELPLGLPAPRLVPSSLQNQHIWTPQPACLLVPSPVPSFIGGLHRRMGLPLPEPWAMPFVGLLCLFYGLALFSGVILLLPGIWRTLMTIRLVGHARRFWLDMHSLLGLCTLPFHLVIALTTALFAFSPFFAMLADGLSGAPHPQVTNQHSTSLTPLSQTIRQGGKSVASDNAETLLPPLQARTLLSRIAPDFRPLTLDYTNSIHTPTSQAERIALHAPLYDADDPSPLLREHHPLLQAVGTDLHGGSLIGRDRGATWLEPHTGQLLESEDLPGRQTMIRQVLTWCLALHFGSFSGEFVRWLYVGLGLCGVGFFHTANQLWLNSHRRKMAGQTRACDTTTTLWASRLGEGCLLGCLLGLSALIALGPAMVQLHPLINAGALPSPAMAGVITPNTITPAPVILQGWHSVSLIYYGLFGLSIIAYCLLPARFCRGLILALSASCLTGATIMALLRQAVLANTATLSLTIALGLGGLGLWAGVINIIRQSRTGRDARTN